MGLVNALLVRWADGYTWVEDAGSIAAHGRHESFLQAGSAYSPQEATRIGQALLNLRSQPQVAVRLSIDPVGGGDEPYVNFRVADDIVAPDEDGAPASYRVHALTVSEDDETGFVAIVPEVNTLKDVYEQRLQRWLDRMANGSMGGTSAAAAPLPPASQPPQLAARRTMPPVSTVGVPSTLPSKPYRPPDAQRVIRFDTTTVGQTGTVHLHAVIGLVQADGSLGAPSIEHAWTIAVGENPDLEPASVFVDGGNGYGISIQATDTGGATYISVTPVLG